MCDRCVEANAYAIEWVQGWLIDPSMRVERARVLPVPVDHRTLGESWPEYTVAARVRVGEATAVLTFATGAQFQAPDPLGADPTEETDWWFTVPADATTREFSNLGAGLRRVRTNELNLDLPEVEAVRRCLDVMQPSGGDEGPR